MEKQKQAKWEDITGLLEDVAAELPVGGIIHGPEFSLYRSMNAVELMDPKMDQGMDQVKILTVRERLDNGDLAVKFSQVEKVVELMDLLMCKEVQFANGCALPTSVCTCLYTHKDAMEALRKAGAETTKEGSLLAMAVYVYNCMLLKCCDFHHDEMMMADIYED